MRDITDITLNGLMLGSLYTLTALGFALVFGISRIVNFAHGQLVMWAAYFTVIFTDNFGWHLLLAAPVVLLATAAIGVGLDQAVFRWTGEENAMIVSIGLIGVSEALAFELFTSTPRTGVNPLRGSVEILGTTIGRLRLVVLLSSIVLLVALWQWLRRSRIGRGMRALAQSNVAARLVGIQPHRITMLSFAIAGALAGIAGLFYATLFSVEPSTGSVIVLKAFIVVIVGGLGSLPGVAIAGFALGLVEVATTFYLGAEWVNAVAFGFMLLVLVVRPAGIAGLRQARVG